MSTQARWPVLGLGALLTLAMAACSEHSRPDAQALQEGQRVYQAECAACHGAKLEGQPDWTIRRSNGRLPAPPHDATGHTWHHPREQLFAIVKLGMVPPNAPDDYASDMPAYAGRLTDREIENVLAWIESQWPPEVMKRREHMLRRH